MASEDSPPTSVVSASTAHDMRLWCFTYLAGKPAITIAVIYRAGAVCSLCGRYYAFPTFFRRRNFSLLDNMLVQGRLNFRKWSWLIFRRLHSTPAPRLPYWTHQCYIPVLSHEARHPLFPLCQSLPWVAPAVAVELAPELAEAL